MLIWAGSQYWDNQNVFDFRAVHGLATDEDTHISMIVNWERDGPNRGKGVMMNKHYHVETEVKAINDLHDFNMHEFNILPGGKTALACIYRELEVSMEDFGRPAEKSWVTSGGFVEMDMETSQVLVQWESFDHIPLHESNMFHAWDQPMGRPGWDYVHANAVDKNEAGDYILSMRFTNTIYGISGEDGHIMWRLGGLESDFDMDFTFSKQHNVKFVSSNGTHHVISMLNNASDERGNDENLSSALFIEMDTVAMTARVIKRINRPDSALTRLRGSVSTLANGNVFIGWSEFGYQSEHAPNGDVLMTARFVGERYSTYRAYKSDFIGRPTTPPDVVASVYGTSHDDITTIIYVSWNGATDVHGWNLYAQAYDRGQPVKIGYANKTDFETMYIVDGYMDWITAEAVDVNGKVMSTSRVARSDIPQNWKAVGFMGESGPSPDDPSIITSVNKESDSTSTSASASTDDSTSTTDTATDTDVTDAVEADKTVDDTTSSGMDGMDMSDDSTSDTADHDNTSYADAKEVAKAVYRAYEVIRGVGGLLIFILLTCSVGGALYGAWHCLQTRKRRSYQHVPSEEGAPVEEIRLRSQQSE
jgi:hypothetical protein